MINNLADAEEYLQDCLENRIHQLHEVNLKNKHYKQLLEQHSKLYEELADHLPEVSGHILSEYDANNIEMSGWGRTHFSTGRDLRIVLQY